MAFGITIAVIFFSTILISVKGRMSCSYQHSARSCVSEDAVRKLSMARLFNRSPTYEDLPGARRGDERAEEDTSGERQASSVTEEGRPGAEEKIGSLGEYESDRVVGDRIRSYRSMG